MLKRLCHLYSPTLDAAANVELTVERNGLSGAAVQSNRIGEGDGRFSRLGRGFSLRNFT
ncbi:MAG: hypothetical protein HQL94_06175 [Magnetococcales bacterium]|nr:hypothetical protein [Magnetococcales bacterium]